MPTPQAGHLLRRCPAAGGRITGCGSPGAPRRFRCVPLSLCCHCWSSFWAADPADRPSGRPYDITRDPATKKPQIVPAVHQDQLYVAWHGWEAHGPGNTIAVAKVGLDQLTNRRLTAVRTVASPGVLVGFTVDATGADHILSARAEEFPNRPTGGFENEVHKRWRKNAVWAADALYSHFLVHPNAALLTGLLPDLVANYRAWEASHQDPSGLFWQSDDRDGMEFSIGGSGYRPTINAYQYGDAVAIARIADLAGRRDLAETYRQKAAQLKTLVQARLWDEQAQFFKTLPRGQGARLVDVREEIGFVPWYFGLPARGYEAAWKQLLDPEGFYAPFGPTTAERRHPRFMAAHRHDCLWNGPSWPYATTQTLVALANLLHDYPQDFVGKKDYLTVLKNYARSQYKAGKPWIAEQAALSAEITNEIYAAPRNPQQTIAGALPPKAATLAGPLTPGPRGTSRTPSTRSWPARNSSSCG